MMYGTHPTIIGIIIIMFIVTIITIIIMVVIMIIIIIIVNCYSSIIYQIIDKAQIWGLVFLVLRFYCNAWNLVSEAPPL